MEIVDFVNVFISTIRININVTLKSTYSITCFDGTIQRKASLFHPFNLTHFIT